jgi:hypothetical protein
VYVPRKSRLSALEEEQQDQQKLASSAASSPNTGGGSSKFFSQESLNAAGGNWINVEDNIGEVRWSLVMVPKNHAFSSNKDAASPGIRSVK